MAYFWLLRYLLAQSTLPTTALNDSFNIDINELNKWKAENIENRKQRIIILEELLKFQNNQKEKVNENLAKLSHQLAKSSDTWKFVNSYQNWNSKILKLEAIKRREGISNKKLCLCIIDFRSRSKKRIQRVTKHKY